MLLSEYLTQRDLLKKSSLALQAGLLRRFSLPAHIRLVRRRPACSSPDGSAQIRAITALSPAQGVLAWKPPGGGQVPHLAARHPGDGGRAGPGCREMQSRAGGDSANNIRKEDM